MPISNEVLTADCRFTGLDHNDCVGHIYLGSIFGEPTKCECVCHSKHHIGAARDPDWADHLIDEMD